MKEFHFNAELAQRYGVNEAVFLHSLVFWIEKNRANGRNFHDGCYWTYNSQAALGKLFPFWTTKQLRRIIDSCKGAGAVLTGNFNDNPRDRTCWYAVSDDVLAAYGMDSDADEKGKCNCPDGQMDLPEGADASAQMGESLKEQLLTPVISPHKSPQGDALFDRFWAAYPRKIDKDKARRAWKKLKVDPELLKVILAGVERDRRSPQWAEDGGRYVPYPATWLNNRRWEAEAPAPPDSPPAEREWGIDAI